MIYCKYKVFFYKNKSNYNFSPDKLTCRHHINSSNNNNAHTNN